MHSIHRSDPESEIPFAKALYSNNKFMQAFFDALSDDGILVMQLGEAPYFGSPDETFSRFKNRLATTRLLEDIGFQSIHAYEEVSRHEILRALIFEDDVTDPQFTHYILPPFKILEPLRVRRTMVVRDWVQILRNSREMV